MVNFDARAAVRIRRYQGARIIFHHTNSSADAIIRNFSALGARLDVDMPANIPAEIEILIGPDLIPTQRLRARKVWANDKTIGVAFEARRA